MNQSVKDIAAHVGGSIIGNPETSITGLNGIREAQSGELTFLGSPQYASFMKTTQASAIFVPRDIDTPHPTAALIQVDTPYAAFAMILQMIEKEMRVHPTGQHPTAAIGENVSMGENVNLDAHVRLAANCTIGSNVTLYAGVYIGRNSVVGDDTIIYPNTSIREWVTIGKRCLIHSNVAIGTDGFGFTPMDGKIMKIPQVGTVEIGDDVEIGSNTAIDRATCGKTIIGSGTKIDNMVQIGHNVVIGENTTISGAVAIAGSTTVGSGVTIGGMAGLNGHIDIGDNVMIAGASRVVHSIPPNQMVSGAPAVKHTLGRKIIMSQKRLPELLRRVRILEKRLEQMEDKDNG